MLRIKDTTTVFVALLVMSVGVLTTNDTTTKTKSVETKRPPVEEYTHYVSIRNKYNHLCGGIVIDCEHVVTAADCVFAYKPEEILIWIRRRPLYKCGVTKEIKDIFVHDQYNANENSIAILQLKENFTEPDYVKPISFGNILIKDNRLQNSIIRWKSDSGAQSLTVQSSVISGLNKKICKSDKADNTVEITSIHCVDNEQSFLKSDSTKDQLCSSSELCEVSFKITPFPSIYKKVSYYLPWVVNRTDKVFAFYESVKSMQITALIIAMALYITLFK